MVGQIGKILGCRVVGIAGGKEKCRTIKELGFDEAIDYREAGDNLKAEIKKICSNGVDCFFDNVGGPVMDAVMMNLNVHARVAICGAISQYSGKHATGPRHNVIILSKSVLVKGFLARDYGDSLAEGVKQMKEWLDQGKIKVVETNMDGIENLPKALMNLFQGKNIGKQIVTVETQQTE